MSSSVYQHAYSSPFTKGQRRIEVLFDKIRQRPILMAMELLVLLIFLLFVAQFGFSEDDEGYDVWFDLDGDGTIGFGDFSDFCQCLR